MEGRVERTKLLNLMMMTMVVMMMVTVITKLRAQVVECTSYDRAVVDKSALATANSSNNTN